MQTTSLTTYHSEIVPTLSDRHQRVMDALRYIGYFTNKELAEFLEWEINSVTPRVNELVKRGLIERKSSRPCKYTGRTAIEWGIAHHKNIDLI